MRRAQGGLSVDALHDLLRRQDGSTSRRKAMQLHEAAAGNPFYALELGSARATAGLSPTLTRVVEDRLGALSGRARIAVEVGAVLGPAAPADFLRFDSVSPQAIDEAVSVGVMVADGGELRFSHPLPEAGALAALPPMRRRELHRRAAATAERTEERARHVALATDGTDSEAASLLEDAAGMSQSRGAPESAITLITHAARLTPPTAVDDLARRKIRRADLLYLAGGGVEASVLIDEVLGAGVRGVLRARALTHRVQHDTDPAVAVARLEEAVVAAQDDDVVRARALASLAWMRGVWGGDVDPASGEVEAAVALAESSGDDAVSTTALTTAESVAGDRSPFVAFAHQQFRRGDWSAAESLLAVERHHAVRNGEESRLERLNVFQADLEIRRGEWHRADELLDAALGWADSDYWRTRSLLWRALLRGRRGDPSALKDVTDACASPTVLQDSLLNATATYVCGLLDLVSGAPADAARRLVPLPAQLDANGLRELSILMVAPDAVEACVAAAGVPAATRLTNDLEQRAQATCHPLGIPAADRCRGLIALAEGDTDRALTRLASSRKGFTAAAAPYELARTLLVEGRALRRAGLRRDAAQTFTTAGELFADLGAHPWRARGEQEQQGVRSTTRGAAELTAAEQRVAQLVVAGRTNREAAAQLYTTVATVEAHLTRVYRKLDLRSRTELARAVSDGRVRLD